MVPLTCPIGQTQWNTSVKTDLTYNNPTDHWFENGTPPSAVHPYLCVSVSRVFLVLMETLVCLDQLERRYDFNIF